MTRTAVIRLKPGVSLDDLPHQLKIAGGLELVVAPGREPLCLRCQRTGHIRRECRVPKCESCERFGHDADHRVRTYAAATGPGGGEANAVLVMGQADAEAANEGVAIASEASDGMAKSDAVRHASKRPLTSTGTAPFNVAATIPKDGQILCLPWKVEVVLSDRQIPPWPPPPTGKCKEWAPHCCEREWCLAPLEASGQDDEASSWQVEVLAGLPGQTTNWNRRSTATAQSSQPQLRSARAVDDKQQRTVRMNTYRTAPMQRIKVGTRRGGTAVQRSARNGPNSTVFDSQAVGYASHARWRDQYRPSRGVNPSEVRPPFRGLTLADRDDEPPAVYTAEEEAALCPVCHVLVVCQEAHAGGKLHTERDQRKKDAAAAAAATEEDIEAALKLLRRERPGLLTPAPDLVPPAAPIPRALELPPLRQSEPVRPAEFIGPTPTDSSATGPGGPITRTPPSPPVTSTAPPVSEIHQGQMEQVPDLVVAGTKKQEVQNPVQGTRTPVFWWIPTDRHPPCHLEVEQCALLQRSLSSATG
ncbi:uncharacterized protein ISCGN_001907 [Ixodes scapularis]